MKDNSLLDEAIMQALSYKQTKVAMIISRVIRKSDCAYTENEIGDRISYLVKTHKIKSWGDVSKWRYSEISKI